MAGTFGSRAKSKFKLPSVDSTQTYYTLVDSSTGETTLKRINPLIPDSKIPGFAEAEDTTVGTIPATGPNKGKFIPNTGILGIGGATPTEIRAFSQQPQAVKAVRNQAEITSQKAILDTGKTPQESQTAASNLLETGKQQNPDTGNEQGSTPATTTVKDLTDQIKDSPNGVRKEYPGKSGQPLSYPINRDPKQDHIKFTMKRYSPRELNVANFKSESNSVFGNRTPGEILGRVTLPIQPSITDTNAVTWGDDEMNPLAAVAQMASFGLISGADASKIAEDAAAGAQGQSGGLKALTAFGMAKAAVGNQGGNLLTRATGGIVNPNLELLFQGPTLRSFTFNFTLSAREQPEADAIKKIIRFFKQGMSVKRASSSLFLMSPNTFEIKYIYGEDGKGKDHPWINKIKECALQTFTVDYTPESTYATFEDGAMTKYDLSLVFKEIDPIYDDDYTEADNSVGGGLDSSIGY